MAHVIVQLLKRKYLFKYVEKGYHYHKIIQDVK